jgi:hypothetical protein
MFDHSASTQVHRRLDVTSHAQISEGILVKSLSLRIHTSASAILRAIISGKLAALYDQKGAAGVVRDAGDQPCVEEVVRSVRFGPVGGRRTFTHVWDVTAVGPGSVEFRPHRTSTPPPPHIASATCSFSDCAHGCSELTMACQMHVAGNVTASSNANRTASDVARTDAAVERSASGMQVLSLKEGHVVLDDLLSLTAILFKLHDRSDEVDEAVHVELARHFSTATTLPSDSDNALIEKVLSYDDRAWRRMPGTVQESVA